MPQVKIILIITKQNPPPKHVMFELQKIKDKGTNMEKFNKRTGKDKN